LKIGAFIILAVVLMISVAGILWNIMPMRDGKNNVTQEKIIESDEIMMGIVSKTEYTLGDAGQIIVEIRDRQYNPINASCLTSILYPNKTYFFQDEPMIDTVLGTEYMNFIVPKVDGVFEYAVNCTYNAKNYMASSSFHVTKGRLKAWIEK
jgi:hypothetical protein